MLQILLPDVLRISCSCIHNLDGASVTLKTTEAIITIQIIIQKYNVIDNCIYTLDPSGLLRGSGSDLYLMRDDCGLLHFRYHILGNLNVV